MDNKKTGNKIVYQSLKEKGFVIRYGDHVKYVPSAREIFVHNLGYLMQEKNVSQADICEKLGVSSATVSDWVNGKKYPRIDAMQRLADLLGVRYSTLTTEQGIDEYKDTERLEALHKNPKLGILFDRAAKVSDEDVDILVSMAERMSKDIYGDE